MIEKKSPGNQELEALKTWSERPVNPQRWAAIENCLGNSFLDVGCGNGSYVLKLAGRTDAYGVDIDQYESWSDNPDRFQVADAASLPFEDNHFDTVVCFEVIEHVPDPLKVLQELARVSRKYVIVTVPNCEIPKVLERSRFTFYHYMDRSHVNFFTRSTLADAFESVGINVERCELINPCDLYPLLSDVFRLPRFLVNLLRRMRYSNAYHMTCLATGRVDQNCSQTA